MESERIVRRKSTQQHRYVGVMVRSAANGSAEEWKQYRRLSRFGERLGIHVIVFSFDDISWVTRTVTGYRYASEQKAWVRRTVPMPGAIYDRVFCKTRGQLCKLRATIGRLERAYQGSLLGNGLRGKWIVYRLLEQDDTLRPSLPRTTLYKGAETLDLWLADAGEAVFKPRDGTHGKGVVHAACTGKSRCEVIGRDAGNRRIYRQFADVSALRRWIDGSLIQGRPYLVQQYLTLTTEEGFPFDIRALVQKDGSGQWRLTGTALRIGPKGGFTSNLHGGGRAMSPAPFLARLYGGRQAENILTDIEKKSLTVPSVLERTHGPLLELGIDFGVDRLGRLWLLEVNSKPGRASFLQLGDKKTAIAAVTRPIRYARYVLDRQLGGQKYEFDCKQASLYS